MSAGRFSATGPQPRRSGFFLCIRATPPGGEPWIDARGMRSTPVTACLLPSDLRDTVVAREQRMPARAARFHAAMVCACANVYQPSYPNGASFAWGGWCDRLRSRWRSSPCPHHRRPLATVPVDPSRRRERSPLRGQFPPATHQLPVARPPSRRVVQASTLPATLRREIEYLAPSMCLSSAIRLLSRGIHGL